MIFVSYSHADEKWRKRFEIISKPLSRLEGIRFWSDRNLKAGEWEPQIEVAMSGSVAAVLMVSDAFLASDYIVKKELPYFLKARNDRGLMIFWAYLEPCDRNRHPEITQFQAMSLGNLDKSMAEMTDWEWKKTMVQGCEMIDEFLKDLERPAINSAVSKRLWPRVAEDIPLLMKPSRRDIDVLVFSGGGKKWWKQPRVRAGKMTTKIYLGDENTLQGTQFQVVAMTTERPLTQATYANLPPHRTKSELTLTRGPATVPKEVANA